jgi:hypothetical protein
MRGARLPSSFRCPIFVSGTGSGRSFVLARRSHSEGSTAAGSPPAGRRRPGSLTWLPAALLGAGLLVGVALWAKWGFAIAFEAIRAYCF